MPVKAPQETIAQFLQRRRFEMGRAAGKRLLQKDMAAHLEKQINNPLVKVSPVKLNTWENGRQAPSPAVEQAIREALKE